MYLENWSEKIPSHIPTIPISNTDTRMYVTAVLMMVTLMIEEMRVYFTSPAALKHPPQMICEICNSTITVMNLAMISPVSMMDSLSKNKWNIPFPNSNNITDNTRDIISPIR